jgi:hypothetical protein
MDMDDEAQARAHLGPPPDTREDDITKTIEHYTAGIPSSAFLAVALGAIGLSLLSQLGGRGKWGNFIAQWAPTLLIMGVYNKLVKLEGHDAQDRGRAGQAPRPSGISNHPVAEEQAEQQSLPPRGYARSA